MFGRAEIAWLAALLGLAACSSGSRYDGDSGPIPSTDAGMMADAARPPVDAETDNPTDGGRPAMPDAGRPDARPEGDVPDAGDSGTSETSCDDGTWNGEETDMDCGGPCGPCGPDLRCRRGSDCMSRVCIDQTCQMPSCTDGIRNGDETDRDCGGDLCGGCGDGAMCNVAEDCIGGLCTDGRCQATTCMNGQLDPGESDVDCGASCAPCAGGATCTSSRDCASGMCLAGVCLAETCINGMQDEGEAAVDCGGECPGCGDGTACTMPVDCVSGRCDDGMCTSCDDGAQTGIETDVDCGGSCSPCVAGRACNIGADCIYGLCEEGVCVAPDAFYREPFEETDGGWTTGGANSSWAWGMPAGSTLNSAGSGANAWATNLTGQYNNSEDSWVQSPVIDLSGLSGDPMLEIAIRHLTEANYDGAWVELSTDGGTTFAKVGAVGEGQSWYNANARWEGDSLEFLQGVHELAGAGGVAEVVLRVGFHSDGSGPREGIVFDDVVIRGKAPPDLAVRVIPAAETCGAVDVIVTNEGEENINGFTLTTGVDGEESAQSVGETLAMGQSYRRRLMLPQSATLFTATIESPMDADPTDNVATLDLTGTPPSIPVGPDGLLLDFNEDDANFTVSGQNPSWAWGMSTAPMSPPGGGYLWATNPTGEYNASENSMLMSRCFDARGVEGDLEVRFLLNYETEASFDEGWLEYSLDGGTTWDKVPGNPASENWYNNTANQWWAGSSNGWVTASSVLPGSVGKQQVRFRFVFQSDFSGNRPGFAIDDISLSPTETDLAVDVVPAATCGSASAVVTNVGRTEVAFFSLEIVADGRRSTRSIPGPLAPGAQMEISVGGPGVMEIQASVRAARDVDPSNDTDTAVLSIPVMRDGYSEDFEASNGGWSGTGTWEYGTPTSTFISGAASGTSAWVTNLDGEYGTSELAYLTSPCFDMRSVRMDPTLTFQRIFQTEPCCDHGWVEVSVDGGATWNKVGSQGSGTGWYDDAADWWSAPSGSAGVWQTASHSLDGAGGESAVRIRFVFTSDRAVGADGFGVDSVEVTP